MALGMTQYIWQCLYRAFRGEITTGEQWTTGRQTPAQIMAPQIQERQVAILQAENQAIHTHLVILQPHQVTTHPIQPDPPQNTQYQLCVLILLLRLSRR